jgi:hypothetical protein
MDLYRGRFGALLNGSLLLVFYFLGSLLCCWVLHDESIIASVHKTHFFLAYPAGQTLIIFFSVFGFPSLLVLLNLTGVAESILPHIALVRGFMLTAMAAILEVSVGWSLESIFIYGIPALLSTSAWFLLCRWVLTESYSTCGSLKINSHGFVIAAILLSMAALIKQLMISFYS